jgi:uncharacterized protein
MTTHNAPRSRTSRSRRLLVLRQTLLRPLNMGLFAAFCCGLALISWQQAHVPAAVPEATQIAVITPALTPAPPLQTAQGYGRSVAPRSLAASEVAKLLNYEEPAALGQAPATNLVLHRPAPLSRPRIAIVIDDIGPDWVRSKAATALPGPLTLALLPYAERVQELAERAQKHGHELIIHMPMEPIDLAHNNPGPIALLASQNATTQREMLTKAFNSFSGYVGLNNHMGSRFSGELAGMQIVLRELAQRKLYFLDSRTSSKSVGAQLAQRYGVPFAGRDVFLDNEQDVGKILQQLRVAEKLARAQGSAIAIGHPHEATISALKQWLPQVRQNGFDLVPVSQLVVQQGEPAQRLAAGQP